MKALSGKRKEWHLKAEACRLESDLKYCYQKQFTLLQ